MNQASDAQGGPTSRWVTFQLEDETYAIEVMQIREVLRSQEISPVPGAPAYVLGIINLRGSVVAIIDTRSRFGLTRRDEMDDASRILIMDSGDMVVGFLVDSVSEVADLVGRDRSTVANALRLLRLPQSVQQMLHSGELAVGHARALLQLTDQAALEDLARLTVKNGLSVREVETRARGTRAPRRRPRTTKGGAEPSPQARRIEDTLRRYLQTDVNLNQRGRAGGRLTIAFYSEDDLARILERILGKPFDG